MRWEFALDVESWDEAPAPARAACLLVQRAFGRDIPVRRARLVNNVTHWGYGTAIGILYDLVFDDPGDAGAAAQGAIWGAAVWLSSYVTLPLLGVYEPIWRYDAVTLRRDLTAHLVFGTSTAGSAAVLAGLSSRV